MKRATFVFIVFLYVWRVMGLILGMAYNILAKVLFLVFLSSVWV